MSLAQLEHACSTLKELALQQDDEGVDACEGTILDLVDQHNADLTHVVREKHDIPVGTPLHLHELPRREAVTLLLDELYVPSTVELTTPLLLESDEGTAEVLPPTFRRIYRFACIMSYQTKMLLIDEAKRHAHNLEKQHSPDAGEMGDGDPL